MPVMIISIRFILKTIPERDSYSPIEPKSKKLAAK